MKESAKVGSNLTRGVEDLDFFIGDEAMDATGYAVKVQKVLIDIPYDPERLSLEVEPLKIHHTAPLYSTHKRGVHL